MMAIKYNPYGWEIRPYVSEAEKCKKKRDDSVRHVYGLIKNGVEDNQYILSLLCDALSAHEEMIIAESDTVVGTQRNLRYFDKKIDELYQLRHGPFHSQMI